jgi:dephospho-CoA kinase
MKVIGLTGSIAMGKSEVAKIFKQHGFPVFDSDAEVHSLYDSPEGAALLKDEVPEATHKGRVDRKIVTELVMKDKDLLSRLEKKVHAEIRKRRVSFLSDATKQSAKIAVVDVPLLFETAADKDVDATIVVSSTPEIQRVRALARPGMTMDRIEMILKRQMPDAEKRKRATHVIENNGTLDDLKQVTEQLIHSLVQETQ